MGLSRLQENFIFDFNATYPISIESDINIATWSENKTSYIVLPNEKFIELSQDNDHDFYRLRRFGIQQNRLVDNATINI